MNTYVWKTLSLIFNGPKELKCRTSLRYDTDDQKHPSQPLQRAMQQCSFRWKFLGWEAFIVKELRKICFLLVFQILTFYCCLIKKKSLHSDLFFIHLLRDFVFSLWYHSTHPGVQCCSWLQRKQARDWNRCWEEATSLNYLTKICTKPRRRVEAWLLVQSYWSKAVRVRKLNGQYFIMVVGYIHACINK